MATAEAETSQDERGAPGGVVYDGFISYSHAADDLLAPRLQAGLQRFAKPWWKRRALRIFRDESSLSASPHLWSSITDALDKSGWFVLLLSPEAAESPWVNNEVEYWLANKDPDRIIPVLTDGDFTWFDDDFISDAAPPALAGAFPNEPRWVDLRFARTDEQLDLNNPRFSAAVADVASAIRGVPKDELESEEVRQHRRTVRTAWAAGFALLALVIVASGAAIYAVGQQNRANAEAERANELAALEATARDDAEAQRNEAQAQRDEAQVAREEARARELEAEAVVALESFNDPELAMLLALEASATSNLSERGEGTLHGAVLTARPIWRDPEPLGAYSNANLSPDGERVVVSNAGTLVVRTVATDTVEWTAVISTSPETGILDPVFTADGSQIIAAVAHHPWIAGLSESVDPRPDGLVDGIYFWDAANGALLTTHEFPCVPEPAVAMSRPPVELEHKGQHPAVGAPLLTVHFSAIGPDGNPGCSRTNLGASVLDPTTGEFNEVASFAPPPGWGWQSMTPDGRLVAVGATQQLIDTTTGVLVAEIGRGLQVLSRDGTRLLSEPATMLDTTTGEPIPTFQTPLSAVGSFSPFSSDGSTVALGAQDLWILDANTGAEVQQLTGAWFTAGMSEDGALLLGAGDDGLVLWDMEGVFRAHGGTLDLGPGFYPTWALETVGDTAIVYNFFDEQSAETRLGVFDLATDQLVWSTESNTGQQPALSYDGSMVAAQEFDDNTYGTVVIRDTATGDVITRLDGLCEWDAESEFGPDCVDAPDNPYQIWMFNAGFSRDGSTIGVSSQTQNGAGFFDTATGELLHATGPDNVLQDIRGGFVFHPTDDYVILIGKGAYTVLDTNDWSEVDLALPSEAWGGDFTPDGEYLVMMGGDSGTHVIETETWTIVRTLDPEFQIEGDLSDDGTKWVTSEFDGVRVWDVRTGELLASIKIPGERMSGAEFAHDDRHVLVTTPSGPASILTWDIDEVEAIARDRLTRSFSDEECKTYRIEACPTLDDIKSG